VLNGIRVLVVEDEALIAHELAEAITTAEGDLVGPYATARTAAAAVREERIDVAILDVNLADGDVTPVLEALSARHVPIIVYTAGEVPAAVRQRHPDLRILPKPVQTARVLAEIRRAAKVRA
jgi:DNA-binding NtrC family response regulator